jgi:hypothetical protein
MFARLQLACERSHGIQMSSHGQTYKADFHKCLSDAMTSRSAKETILTQRFAKMVLDAEILDAGRFLFHLP